MAKHFSYFLIVLIGLSVFPAAAQRSPVRFGVKAGAGLYQLNFEYKDKLVHGTDLYRLGFYGGALVEISGPAGSKLKGQIEVLFQQHFLRNHSNAYGLHWQAGTRLSQISVPLMLRYFPIPALSFNAGASVNFNIHGEGERLFTGYQTPWRDDFNLKGEGNLQPIQFGVLAGASYYIYKGLFVDARYNYLFGQITISEPKQWLHGFQLGIGYKFGSPN